MAAAANTALDHGFVIESLSADVTVTTGWSRTLICSSG